MTKRDFFKILIKALAILFLVETAFLAIPLGLLSGGQGELGAFIRVLITLLLLVGLVIVLFRNLDRIIDGLRLDRGFDDDQILLGQPAAARR